jgi:hypothetical protein
LTEVRTSVYNKALIFCFNMNGGTQPLIAKVERLADFARAANNWHTLGCSGAQKCNLHI